jgi:hypothetical protein
MRITQVNLGALCALLLAFSIAIALTPVIQSAFSATASRSMKPYKILNDEFMVYDFLSEGEGSARSDNVDWAINVIFAHDATINTIKNAMHGFYNVGYNYGATESRMYARINDGPGWTWDRDGGMKSAACGGPNAYHYRIYAPSPPVDHFYNQNWGSYVIGSTHIDHNECAQYNPLAGNDIWSGHEEWAEAELWEKAKYYFGKNHATADSVVLGNSEPTREVGSHWWENEGRALYVHVN